MVWLEDTSGANAASSGRMGPGFRWRGYYDYQTGIAPWSPAPDPPGPAWLREAVGIDFFADVVLVNLEVHEEHDLSPLVGLPQLEALVLGNAQLCDLSSLQELRHLEQLTLVEPYPNVKELRETLPQCQVFCE